MVVRDVRSLTGAEMVAEYGVPEVIVASPPCQEFSYMAMPWTKAKEKEEKIQSDPLEQKRLTDLFNQCFRIQREVSEAAGHYVPIIIENVKGAQKWVGKARWNFGSFYLWGDVPALMPIPGKKVLKPGVTHRSDGSTNFHQWEHRKGAGSLDPGSENRWDKMVRGEGHKTSGMNWSDQTKRGQDFTRIAGTKSEGRKKVDEGHDYPERTFGWKAPHTNSRSLKCKEASALIAKIPPRLAEWVAKCFKPSNSLK